MYSMTGYGKGEAGSAEISLTVEVKSVNNRYLDLSVKSPRIFLPLEEKIRGVVRENIARGHVDVFISYTDRRERPRSVDCDLGAARAYYEASRTLLGAFPGIADDVTLAFLLRQPDVLKTEEAQEEDDVLDGFLFEALRAALSALKAMRKAEGERLKKDLFARMETISSLRDRIEARAPAVAVQYREKLTARIEEFLAGKADESRILTEAALFADKCSIDEELDRLASHITEFYKICEYEEAGKRLDFLVQEFNRECNTVCSKSNDKEITALALEMKNEIEKVREQVQNLE